MSQIEQLFNDLVYKLETLSGTHWAGLLAACAFLLMIAAYVRSMDMKRR